LKTHFQAIGPKRFLKTVSLIIAADALEADGNVAILFMPFSNVSVSVVYGAEKQRAGQPPDAAHVCGGVFLTGGGLTGGAVGHSILGSAGGGRIRRNLIVGAKELLGATNFPRATLLAYHSKDLAAGLIRAALSVAEVKGETNEESCLQDT
jgi:hypothetical protein